MKKKVLGSMLVAATVVSTFALANQVDAADAHKVDSDASLIFKEGTDGPGPLDPDNPKPTPIDPEHPINPIPNTPLKFEYVPYLDFGTNKISALSQDINAKFVFDTAKKQYTNFVQVTDLRGLNGGKTGGWRITANFNGEFKTDDGAKLDETKIVLKPGVVKSRSDISDPDLFPTLSVTPDAPLAIGNGTAAELAAADGAKKQGYGTWQFLFGDIASTGVTPDAKAPDDVRNSAVTLTVPAGKMLEKDKEYKAKINWTLTDSI